MSDDTSSPTGVPDAASKRGCLSIAAITVGRLAVHGFALFLLLIFFCSGVPGMWGYFEQEEMKVPQITAQVYSCYYWLNSYGLVALPLFMLVDALVLAWLESRSPTWRWLVRVWFVGWIVAILVVVTIASLSLIVPIQALVEPQMKA